MQSDKKFILATLFKVFGVILYIYLKQNVMGFYFSGISYHLRIIDHRRTIEKYAVHTVKGVVPQEYVDDLSNNCVCRKSSCGGNIVQ